ncbi:MAG: type II toxin-antitoxin system VapC family toxin [Clostridiales bacterium]|nr:type II toxin-antitoxin system VapC family toxin [Clostridiales bacterium]
MKYMLDTNVCIFILKRDSAVLSAFAAKRDKGAAISAITLAELEFGVCNSGAVEKNRTALLSFLPNVEILPFDGTAAACYGEICSALRKKGRPIGTMDTLIAAHAKAAKLTVVTANTREFERVDGLLVEDWSH